MKQADILKKYDCLPCLTSWLPQRGYIPYLHYCSIMLESVFSCVKKLCPAYLENINKALPLYKATYESRCLPAKLDKERGGSVSNMSMVSHWEYVSSVLLPLGLTQNCCAFLSPRIQGIQGSLCTDHFEAMVARFSTWLLCYGNWSLIWCVHLVVLMLLNYVLEVYFKIHRVVLASGADAL